jgi:hypothetical protein
MGCAVTKEHEGGRANLSYSQELAGSTGLRAQPFQRLRMMRNSRLSHHPDEISRTFKNHCSKCNTWNQVTVHRLPADGNWDEAHPYFCAECGHELGTERGFRVSVEEDRDY